MTSFTAHCIDHIEANNERIKSSLDESLMLVKALVPHIGHDRAALIAGHAQRTGTSLREAALSLGGLTPDQFDSWVDARRMLGPTVADTSNTRGRFPQ